jgi:hypothetical protein
MSRRFRAIKGALYIGVGVASPLLLIGHPVMATLQTIVLIALGSFSIYHALEKR